MAVHDEFGMQNSEAHNSAAGWFSREVEAMEAAWARGASVTAEEVLARHSDLDTECAIRLIYEEACLRRESGQHVATSEVVARFPHLERDLRALFECDRLIRSPRGITQFPETGEMLGPFLLLAELGRGRAGRTFLASDPSLADRPVVVKLIPDEEDEHLALARLRHTHIVPLFSEHRCPERGLRLLCMPFLGGASLARILEDLDAVPLEDRTGELLVKVIDNHTRAAPASPRADGPYRRSLMAATYVEAMTWIASCLADALEYSHARGLVHMDLKPSNVLITMDGQPMLLDFHLARGPILPGERDALRLGGTPGWMSPEQERAMRAIEEGRPVPLPVDERSDIYALGLLLAKSVGAISARDDARSPVELIRPPAVSVGLLDILKKCLAARPGDRYADASAVAEDLRRELNDLPLRGVRNRSIRERFWKWRRRHPGLLTLSMLCILVVAAAGLSVGGWMVIYSQRVAQIRSHLEDGRQASTAGRFDEATREIGRGLEAAAGFPAPASLLASLRSELLIAERGRIAETLHDLADRVRASYGAELPSRTEGETLLRHCRAVWERRNQLLGAGIPLSDEPDAAMRTDLLELAAILSDLRIALAPAEGLTAARRDAALLLDEAEALCGQSFALDARRGALAEPSPESGGRADARRPASAWEHYELGRYYLRNRRLEDANRSFQRSIDLEPQDFWANFHRGLCSYRLGRYEEAAADFRVCVAIEPGCGAAYYNRALAYDALRRGEETVRDYTKAIDLAPELAAPRLNRGIIAYKEGRLTQAVADFESGLETAVSDRAMCARLRFNLALAHLALGNRPSARMNGEKALELGFPEAKSLLDSLK